MLPPHLCIVATSIINTSPEPLCAQPLANRGDSSDSKCGFLLRAVDLAHVAAPGPSFIGTSQQQAT